MSIFHFHGEIVGRKKGHDVVAKSAYQSRSQLINENTGRRANYSNKGRCLFSGIFVPESAPGWLQRLVRSRQTFWSTVEAAEKRKDAQVARVIEVALPHEITNDQRRELAVAFVREAFVAEGMVADLAIHPPPRDGDYRNFHAHVLLTMRAIESKGFGKKNRSWNTRATFQKWRKQYEITTNQHLELCGHDHKISRLSLQEQGIDREPLIHINPAANYAERWGRKTQRGNKIRDIKERNRLCEALSLSEARSQIKAAMENRERQYHLSCGEEARAAALANIGNAIRSDQQLSQEDFNDLNMEDLEKMKELDIHEVQRMLKHSDLNLEAIIER